MIAIIGNKCIFSPNLANLHWVNCMNRIHSTKGGLLLLTQDSTIKKGLVGLSIQKALLDVGQPILDEVTKRLEKEYKCYIFDCYDKPEILCNILNEMYGKSSKSIVYSIKRNLEEFSNQEQIRRFLVAISA